MPPTDLHHVLPRLFNSNTSYLIFSDVKSAFTCNEMKVKAAERIYLSRGGMIYAKSLLPSGFAHVVVEDIAMVGLHVCRSAYRYIYALVLEILSYLNVDRDPDFIMPFLFSLF